MSASGRGARVVELLTEIKEKKEETKIENKENDLPDCCKAKNERNVRKESKNSGALSGVLYGLVPHAGCIAFIAASVLGVTVATEFFKPLLLNPFFFYALIALSLVFATLSAALYLRRNGALSFAGAKRSWKYLSVLYGTTVAVNLLLFMVVFPLAANMVYAQPVATQSAASGTSGASDSCGLQQAMACQVGVAGVSGVSSASGLTQPVSKLSLRVDIPCPGHAPLISGELKKIAGVESVNFRFPNLFDVEYDSSKTSQQQILGISVFETYKASVLS